VIGFAVLQSAETPGLGDKIETDPAFLANFDGLSVALNDAATALAHEIVTVKSGTKTEAWQIDGITGATVSSVAVGKALRESTARMVPLLAPHVAALQQIAGEAGE
jgi:Na+-translocating ferredoxin:NAD+ oxidoreductase subunit G